MAAVCSAIRSTDDHMSMESWLSIFLGNISCERQDLYLFRDRYLLISLLLRVKESQRDFAESANPI